MIESNGDDLKLQSSAIKMPGPALKASKLNCAGDSEAQRNSESNNSHVAWVVSFELVFFDNCGLLELLHLGIPTSMILITKEVHIYVGVTIMGAVHHLCRCLSDCIMATPLGSSGCTAADNHHYVPFPQDSGNMISISPVGSQTGYLFALDYRVIAYHFNDSGTTKRQVLQDFVVRQYVACAL